MPLLAGGDYDGLRPCAGLVAAGELEQVRRLTSLDLDRLEPFFDAIRHGRESALDALLEHPDRFSIHGFDERTSWSITVP
jgi:hypothetical protein